MQATTRIISTKLVPPSSHWQVLHRERLSAVLREVSGHRLTVVKAGPGYGKTTLLTKLTELGTPVIWYSLSPTDRDLPVFLSYLVEGFGRKFSGFNAAALQTAIGQPELTLELFLPQFIAEVEKSVRDKVIVVLDDFHLVSRNKGVAEALDQFLRYFPDNIHLVVSSRTCLQLPCLPKMSATGLVLNINEVDLQFTADEVGTLFDQVYGLPLTETTVESLREQTEGWALGLQLVSHSWKGKKPEAAEGSLVEREIHKKPLFEYLMEEVLGQQTPKVQRFLKESSILSHFDASICRAALGWSDADKMLTYLEQNSLFCNRLDDRFLRYHHVFRDFLRHQCAKDGDRFKELHLKAATYFELSGDAERAVYHYLSSQEYFEAARLIVRVAEPMLRMSRFDTLSYWTDKVPPDVLESFPELLVYRGNIHEFCGHWDKALECYDRAGGIYNARGDYVGLSRVLDVKGYLLQWGRGENSRLDGLQQEALGYLNWEHRRERASLLSHIGLALFFSAKPVPARKLFEEALDIYREENDKEGLVKLNLHLGFWLNFMSGDFSRALAELSQTERLAEELNSKHHLVGCHNYMAMVLRYTGRYDEAREYAQRALELSREIHSLDAEGFALMILGHVAHTGGREDFDRALDYYRLALKALRQVGDERWIICTLAWMATARRRQGKMTEAQELAREAVELARRTDDQSLTAYSLMAQGSVLAAAGDGLAKEPLLEALRIWSRMKAKYFTLCTHFWLAMLCKAHDTGDILGHLRVCFDLSSQNGYDNFFIEEGATAVPLLIEAVESGIQEEYAKRVLWEMNQRSSRPVQAMLAHCSQPERDRAQRILKRLGGEQVATVVKEMRNQAERRTAEKSRPAWQNDSVPVRIFTFGEFQVYRGEELIGEQEWRRKKTKDLFKYLVTVRDQWVHREVILDLFWPDMEPRTALNNFRVTLCNLRQALGGRRGECRHSHYVQCSEEHYRLDQKLIAWLDAEEFEKTVGNGMIPTKSNMVEFEGALRLYKGPYLQKNRYDDWARPERDRLAKIYLAALEKLAKHYEACRDYEKSADYRSQIIDLECCEEEAHRNLMRCYALAGRRREALRQYEACVQTLRNELGVHPAKETVDLYQRISVNEEQHLVAR